MKNFYVLILLLLTTIGFSNAATVISTAAGGNWSSGTSWVGNAVPSATDDVQIISGSTVTLNASLTTRNLQIAGALNFSSAALTLTINGNLTISSGGILTTSDGAFAKSVVVNGNLVNNGNIDLSYASSTTAQSNLTMGEAASATSISGPGIFNSIRQLTINNSKGVSLSVPLTVSYTLVLNNGVFSNGTNLTLNRNAVGNATSTASQSRVQRSQGSSLAQIYTLAANCPLNILYVENTSLTQALITEGYETVDRDNVYNINVNTTGGVQLSDDITLKASGAAISLTKGILNMPEGKTITINQTSATAPISGGSATSYVNGAIAVTVGTTAVSRTFIIGDETGNRKVAITGLAATAGTAVVRFAIDNSASDQHGISARRWVSTVSGTISPFTSIAIDFGTDDNIGSTKNVIASSSTLNGTYTSLGIGTKAGSTITSPTGIFSNTGYFALASSTVLPVSLSFFNAKISSDGIKTEWETASEERSDYFIVERSIDGKAFTPVSGQIKAKGNSGSTASYSFIDIRPHAGNNYYRLVQADQDGSVTYYGPMVVNYTIKSEVLLKVYPNPSTDKVNVKLVNSMSNKADVLLMDMNGSLVYKVQNVDVSNGVDLQLKDKIQNGIYILQVNNRELSKTTKLIIN